MTDTRSHSVTDASGLGLFDSGLRDPGNSFTHAYDAAGAYAVTDAASGTTSVADVPIAVAPRTGASGTTFTVTWSVSPPPAGDLFDVQIKAPGAASFAAWATGVSETSDPFAVVTRRGREEAPTSSEPDSGTPGAITAAGPPVDR